MNYSRSDIESMRRDALRRTHEMHKKVSPSSHAEQKVQAKNQKLPPPPTDECNQNNNNFKNDKKSDSDPIGNLFSSFFSGGKIDNDKLIIIMLIIILAKEGTDLKLLIALVYILM